VLWFEKREPSRHADGRAPAGTSHPLGCPGAPLQRPQVFLLDEPLSNLDAMLRNSIRAELQ
jgi:ABC-type proline/glycine betaine transport system ATPase subunit